MQQFYTASFITLETINPIPSFVPTYMRGSNLAVAIEIQRAMEILSIMTGIIRFFAFFTIFPPFFAVFSVLLKVF